MKNQLEFYNTPSGYVMYDDGQNHFYLNPAVMLLMIFLIPYASVIQMRTVHLINVILRLLRIQGSRTIKWYTGS